MGFRQFFSSTYGKISADSIPCGRAVSGSKPSGMEVRIPLSSLCKHCLIAGSTGTGKSRSAQLIAEALSERGIPVLFTDVKGDVSDFATPGDASKVDARSAELGYGFSPSAFPAQYWSLGSRLTPLKLRLDEMNPALLAKFMGLNPTQESHLAVILPYARQRKLDVAGLGDLVSLLEFLRLNPNEVSGLSASTLDVILRKCSGLQASGLDSIFSKNALEPADLLQTAPDGRGAIHVLSLAEYRNRPEIFSAATAFILNRIFNSLPDVGETGRPRLALFLDEAHYLFINANRSLVDLMTTILRQIRSKGVAVFFITQEPGDISEGVLGQLGNKVQFALRAFTQKDLDEIRAISKGFPPSSLYKIQEELKTLPVATSLCAFLNEKGALLPPVKVAWYPPASSMGIASDAMMRKIAMRSPLHAKYSKKDGGERMRISSGRQAVSGKRAIASAVSRAGKNEGEHGAFSLVGKLARKLVGFLGYVIDKIVKGILNFIGWLLHKLIFAPLTGVFHTLTFRVFRRKRKKKR